MPPMLGAPHWQGRDLVAPKYCRLPQRCVVCNEPAELRRFKLNWYPPWVAVLMLCAVVPFLIVAMLLQKSGTIYLGVCPTHRAVRRNWILGGWAVLLLGLVLFFLGFLGQTPVVPFVGLLLMLVGIASAGLAGKPFVLKKIDKYSVWLRNVHPQLLEGLAPPPPAAPLGAAFPGAAPPGFQGQGD
jgi:hypothetical protein